MATTNPVFQVLVTSGDQAPLAAGSRVDALAPGQIGVFNYHTGLSLGAASIVGDTRDIFIAVGLNKTGAGGGATLEDINKSAGQVIQVRNAKSLTVKGYIAGRPKIVDIAGFTAKCETDYAIKVELRNGEVYLTNGYNQFAKTFNYRTGCCADQCEPCGDGDCVELARGLQEVINNDPDALIVASLFATPITFTVNGEPTADGSLTLTVGTTAYTVPVLGADNAAQAAAKIVTAINDTANSPYRASAVGANVTVYPKATANDSTATVVLTADGGTGTTINAIVAATKTVVADGDLDAFVEANPGVCFGIRLTSNPAAINTYAGSINLGYEKVRSTDLIVSMPEGFTCNGTVETIQEIRYTEGSGYDLRWQEYIAGGWNGKPGPYRQSSLTGLERQGFEFYASTASNYNQVVLTYDQMSVGGWLEYLNNLETVIAIPCADTTTLTGLIAIFDAIFTQFAPSANDVAAMDCTNVPVDEINNPATDGVESLA